MAFQRRLPWWYAEFARAGEFKASVIVMLYLGRNASYSYWNGIVKLEASVIVLVQYNNLFEYSNQ
jgi:hypothetical protein